MGGNAFFTGFTQTNNDLQEQNIRHFINMAPRINFSFRPKQGTELSFRYSGQTVQPSVEQLQPLRRSTNKLYVTIGNPDLQPGFRHIGDINFYRNNWAKGKYFYVYFSVSYISNSTTNRTFIDSQNRTTTQYINLDGLPNLMLSTSYNWQYKKYHLRPGVRFYASKNGNYTIQNDQQLKNESLNLNGSFSLNYDFKKLLTAGYKGNVSKNIGWSNIPGRRNTSTLTHSHDLDVTVYLPGRLELTNDCTFNFQPKNASFNTNFNTIQWNAFLQKKFLKNDQAIIKFSVNDILNNNTGYRRSVNGSNVYESDKLVIKRYWLLTMTWNFSKSL